MAKQPCLLCPAAPAVWFAADAPAVPAAPAAFKARAHEVGGLVVLRHPRAGLLGAASPPTPADLAAIAAAPPAQPVECRVLRYRANELALGVVCPQAGFLLLTDRWSRSWEATVNGRAVPVEGGNFIFRLVPVAAGQNLVEMRFRPPGVFPLLALSWVTLAAVGVGSAWLAHQNGVNHRGHRGYREEEGMEAEEGVGAEVC